MTPLPPAFPLPPAPSPSAARSQPLPALPGTLGVLGGGQLARMFAHAAQMLGWGCAVLDPDPDAPAAGVADIHVQAGYDDAQALADLARRCIAVTIEFENVPAGALRLLAEHGLPVAPSDAAVQVCQDRVAEKRQFRAAGIFCAPHAVIASRDAAGRCDPALLPGILKTARLGYDGKGQAAVPTVEALLPAWESLGGVDCVLERRLPLRCEFSVIVARGADGALVHLPPQQNLHRNGILAVTQVPAPDVPADLTRQAVQHAGDLALALGYVGVLCVEFFVLDDGSLVANEMAPRPHNSGHHSIDSCDMSQFALQVRTLAGLPLAVPRLHSPAVMLNLLGDLWCDAPGGSPDWAPVLALPGAHLHLYGKAEARRGRKMGHLTVTAADAAGARATALRAAGLLGLPLF